MSKFRCTLHDSTVPDPSKESIPQVLSIIVPSKVCALVNSKCGTGEVQSFKCAMSVCVSRIFELKKGRGSFRCPESQFGIFQCWAIVNSM